MSDGGRIYVRTLGEADVEDFWRLRLRGFLEEPESFGTSYEEAVGLPSTERVRAMHRDGVTVAGAFSPGLVGIAGLDREARRKRRHRATLWGMYVIKEARGRGVGRLLLEQLVVMARATDGLEQVVLTVMAHNEPAIALYRRLGFEMYGRASRAMQLGDRAFDEVLMRLDL
jgi:ribosomal protein S18 acetylase RimI-like enzyme